MKLFLRIIGAILLVSGLALIIASISINVIQAQEKESALESFYEALPNTENGESTDDELQTVSLEDSDGNTLLNSSEIIYVVRIPKIDSKEPVKEGTNKSALSASLGHEPGTASPGEIGNCVIAGHRNYNFGKYFNRLDEVEVGDEIFVDTRDDTYEYKVTEIKVVNPEDVEILDPTDDEQLTLYTCTPIYIATHRLVVIAKRTEENA
ncbi:class D sortase [Butyrivibrio sp. X503]|uniref:sortase n=1 Tax=Butyrivibrio sp. X503 TaxID=2364878 RepID=UPI000EA8AD99|nr:class D sortase [Butyrivibrio sp. X503]RKM55550.1 class D sortase [Butyrivibrio sp. X503]